jgi:hypothetical protein
VSFKSLVEHRAVQCSTAQCSVVCGGVAQRVIRERCV